MAPIVILTTVGRTVVLPIAQAFGAGLVYGGCIAGFFGGIALGARGMNAAMRTADRQLFSESRRRRLEAEAA
jgi:hypothetical protein